MENFNSYRFCLFRLFFWSVNWVNLVCKLCLLFQTILDLWAVLILEFFCSVILKRVSSVLSFFSYFILIFRLYKSGLYIMISSGNRQCFIWGFLVFSFLVFSVYKYLKSMHLFLLAIFPYLEFFLSFSLSTVLVCKLNMPGL